MNKNYRIGRNMLNFPVYNIAIYQMLVIVQSSTCAFVKYNDNSLEYKGGKMKCSQHHQKLFVSSWHKTFSGHTKDSH